jgi:carbon-monoxide dehydrogenase iron sulfur subunit
MKREPAGDKVTVDAEKCIGCWTCIIACPYGALSRDANSRTVIKCDLCPEREIPACVLNCPNEALVLGVDSGEE